MVSSIYTFESYLSLPYNNNKAGANGRDWRWNGKPEAVKYEMKEKGREQAWEVSIRFFRELNDA